LLVNDPVNPTGRMLDESERAAIRDVALAHDLLIIADEVWEEVRPDSRPHISLAVNPALAGRVVKIGSAGKIFQVTGWKIGWAMAAAPLAARIAATHQYLTFTSSPSLQDAVAYGLNHERPWLATMRAELETGRARLADGLAAAGYAVLPSEASWFLSIDLTASGIALVDTDFCTRIVDDHGIAGIPVSAFFETEGAPTNVVRFCHAKAPATIDAALERLAAARRVLA
jgi:aspartate/methionine/tyrosine aminotransferase